MAHGAVDKGADPSGLGRYAWTRIKGRRLSEGEDSSEGEIATANSKDLILVSAYRPTASNDGMSTVWMQQKQFFAAKGDPIDPREAFTRDLLKEIVVWRTKGFEVIVGIDVNEDLVFDGPNSFLHRMRMVGMEEAIMQRHGTSAPATYQRRAKQVPIDGLFVSPGVIVRQSGYLGFLENIHSDHRCLWLDIDLKVTLGGYLPHKSNSSPRKLALMDGPSVKRYIDIAEREYLRLNIPNRLASLLKEIDQNSGTLTPRQQKSFNFLHKQMYDARRLAEDKCRKIRKGGVPWSPAVQEVRDRITLWKALLSAAKGCAVSSRKLRRLMKKTQYTEAWKFSVEELEKRLQVDRACYLKIKKSQTARKLRSQFVVKRREWARKRQHKSLHGLSRLERMQRMNQREETRRRKRAQGKGYSGGLKAIQIERKRADGSVQLVTIEDPQVVAEGCMKENQSRYDQTRAPFSTPPMDEPLYSLFTGAEAGDNVKALVEGRLDDPDVDPYTREFLHQCRISPHLPRQDLSVEVEDHIDFWAKMKESKGSEPHGLHNGHYKAGVKSDLLAQCDTVMRDIPMTTGFSPEVWQNLMNFSIEKQPGEFRLSKMRTIQLMNSELQANNKKVGKAAMAYAEKHGLIPSGQCGSRKAHESMELVISKRNNWDLLRQQRRAAGWISNDAKSCFDRIVHWIGMVALYRFGIPWPTLLMMFGTLQVATHRVRTGFGDCPIPFFPPSWYPFQGCGQGNGAGPTIWVARTVSASLMIPTSLRQPSLSKHPVKRQLFRSIQNAMNLWAGGVRATGGALNPPKCFWWLIDWKWDATTGEYRFRRISDFDWSPSFNKWQLSRPSEWVGSLLTNNLDGSLVALRQLEPWEAEKTLGVMMSPDDNGKAEYEYLLEKTNKWANAVKSSRLLKYDVLPMLRSTIMKTIEYPMALTTFSQKQWYDIMSPALLTCLPKAGVCRYFKRLSVFSPLKYQGLGLPHPLVTQVLRHLSTIMKNLSVDCQGSGYLRAVLEGHRLETGTHYELFQQEFQNTAILTTNTWLKQVWKEFDGFGIHLETDSWDFQLLREDDQLLMEIFIDHLAPQEELKWLNWCRLYLHAVTLSDIVTADGVRVTQDAWMGRRTDFRQDRYQWPRTCRPPESAWNIWRTWLSKTLLSSGSSSRQLQHPLGGWLDDISEWKWVYAQSTSQLFHREGTVWRVCPCISHSPRLSNRIFTLQDLNHNLPFINRLPVDACRASVALNSDTSHKTATISGLGISASDGPDEVPRPPSLHEAWKEAAQLLTDTYGWVPDKIRIQGDEKFLFECLIKGLLRIVSDGSFKNKMGTAVIQLRPKCQGHAIWVYCQTPGKPDDQSAYRSELIGILAGIMVTSWLLCEWQKYNVNSPNTPSNPTPTDIQVEFACDGISALRQAFIFDGLSPSQPQFDLISSIRAAVRSSGITWKPRHVKGHADAVKSKKKMDWWEKRNVEVDKKANEYRKLLEAKGRFITRNPRFFSEPCALFIKGEKASSLNRSDLEDLIVFPQLVEWWDQRGRISPQGAELVDWDVVQRAMKALPDGMQRWCTKHVAGMCAVGKVRKARGLDSHDCCPLCSAPEDHRHVPRCTDARAKAEWQKRVDEFTQWLHDFGTAPEITEAFSNCLQQIREPAHTWYPRTSRGQVVPINLLTEAYSHQQIIGPQGFLEGLLSSKWAPLQEIFFSSNGSRRSGRKWASQVAQRLIKIGFFMWEHRNSVFHSEDSVANKELAKILDAEIRRQFQLKPANLSRQARLSLSKPIGRVLSLPLRYRQKWVAWIQAERALMERSTLPLCRAMYHACATGKSRSRLLHRSQRVFRETFQDIKQKTKQTTIAFLPAQ